MSEWAPPVTSLSRTFWESWFLPNVRYLGLVIAAAELTIAALIFGRGAATRLGFACATAFHTALAVLFGMWPYTVPTTLLLAAMTRVEFPDGPAMRLWSHVPLRSRKNETSAHDASGRVPSAA
jgi:hypothetical protein